MPTLTASGITIYKCATWTEGATHGGNISTAVITSSTDQNIFDDVTNSERVAGDIEYRKIYIRNGNATEWSDVICWIPNNTQALNDEIYICAGGKSSYQGSSTTIPGVGIFHNGSTTVTGTGTYFLKDLAVGEAVYNVTNDSALQALTIDSIASNTSLELIFGYGGTGGSSKNIAVAPITNIFVNFVQPDTSAHAQRLILGDLGPAATTNYKAVWIRRNVWTGFANGYTNNYFSLMFQVDGDV
jgi:hypothetical protein